MLFLSFVSLQIAGPPLKKQNIQWKTKYLPILVQNTSELRRPVWLQRQMGPGSLLKLTGCILSYKFSSLALKMNISLQI